MALPKSSLRHDFDLIRWGVAARLKRPLEKLEKAHELRFRRTSRQDVFTHVYESTAWGSRESGSGTASELRATGNVREWLPDVLSRLRATSLLDAPCGDWNWMQHVDLSGLDEYYGVDIVRPAIEQNAAKFGGPHRHFAVADLTRDTLPQADAILCRDTLVHVSYQDAAKILADFAATGATWLLLNTYPEVSRNRNQFTGHRWRRLNFRLEPFGFPEPLEMMPDGGDVDPSQLSVWRLQELPPVRLTLARRDRPRSGAGRVVRGQPLVGGAQHVGQVLAPDRDRRRGEHAQQQAGGCGVRRGGQCPQPGRAQPGRPEPVQALFQWRTRHVQAQGSGPRRAETLIRRATRRHLTRVGLP